jgi:shikimate dehydrogenase
MITGKTKLLGVIGSPIEHSLSPIMHNAALAEMGLDYAYLPFAIAPEQLSTALAGFAAIDLRGFSITIPHKQMIMPLLTQVTEVAQTIGAVNTVWRTEQGWCGTNTDVTGFLAPLQAMPRAWDDAIAVVLGNGGAARAVVAACVQLGFAEIHVVGRSPEKLAAFRESWSGAFTQNLLVQDWSALRSLLPKATLLVNTTPIGMSPHGDHSPLDPSDMDCLSAGAIAYDLIYVPKPTLFLQQAAQRGCVAIDGLEMLVKQGAAALEIWTQQPVPVETMQRSLQQYLGI